MTEPRVYQAADGRWIVFNNDIKSNYFVLQEDAENMATKLTFASQTQLEATKMAKLSDRVTDIVSVYFDRGYNGGGADPIVDGDIISLNITAAQLSSFITLGQEFANFLGNLAVATADYDSTLNAIRDDI